jgi:hypothetical protein
VELFALPADETALVLLKEAIGKRIALVESVKLRGSHALN